MEFLFVPNSSILKQEITLYSSLEYDQIVRTYGHDSVDYVDLYIVENAVDNLVLLEQP